LTRNKAVRNWNLVAEFENYWDNLTAEAQQYEREMFVRHVEFLTKKNYPSENGCWQKSERLT